jgi:hypothetical protein
VLFILNFITGLLNYNVNTRFDKIFQTVQYYNDIYIYCIKNSNQRKKYDFFWRKIVIFHMKYPKNFLTPLSTTVLLVQEIGESQRSVASHWQSLSNNNKKLYLIDLFSGVIKKIYNCTIYHLLDQREPCYQRSGVGHQ